MDRTLKLFKPSGHKMAEIVFSYDKPRQVSARITEFRQLYDDGDPEDESKSVYEGMQYDAYVDYREFDSLEKIKAFDREFVQKELGRDLTAPLDSYQFVYDAGPVLLRYVATNPREVIGIVNVRFSFINNTKEVAFLSASHPRFDMDIVSNSLETNVSCLNRITIFDDHILQYCDLKKLDPWY